VCAGGCTSYLTCPRCGRTWWNGLHRRPPGLPALWLPGNRPSRRRRTSGHVGGVGRSSGRLSSPGHNWSSPGLGLVRVRTLHKTQDAGPKLLRRRLHVSEIKRVTIKWFETSRLAPASVCQETARFQAVRVAPHGVAGDRPPELSERQPILADQSPCCLGKRLRPSARVARLAWPKASAGDPSRCSAVVLNTAHRFIFAKPQTRRGVAFCIENGRGKQARWPGA
jgi:hypothetical protein